MPGKSVTVELCDERNKHILDKLDSIERLLQNDLAHLAERVAKLEKDKSTSGRDLKRSALQIFSGLVCAVVGWALAQFHP